MDLLYRLLKALMYRNAGRLEELLEDDPEETTRALGFKHIPLILNGRPGDPIQQRPMAYALTAERIEDAYDDVGSSTKNGACPRSALGVPRLRHAADESTEPGKLICALFEQLDHAAAELEQPAPAPVL